MSKHLAALALLMCCTTAPSSAQSKRGPSTAEERTKALAMIEDLEKNPLGPKAKDERKSLTFWLIEVPDIHVGFCTDIYPDRPKGDKQDSSLLSVQLMFSGAHYAIEHPGSTANDPAQIIAGVNGMLRMYEALIAQKPEDRQPGLDGFIQRRAAGTLNDYVMQQFAAHCTAKATVG